MKNSIALYILLAGMLAILLLQWRETRALKAELVGY